jgi:dephospho-CoA kinase
MLLVGLTGGIACGKSTVSRYLADAGAVVIDADRLAWEALGPGSPGARAVARAFGRDVAPGGVVDRARLAALVFGHPRRLRRLEAIVHPRVFRAQRRLTREIAARDPAAVIVFDAALLIETGAHRGMDKVIVVTADRATQLARLKKRDRLTRPQALARITSQWPLRVKRRAADYLIDGRAPRRLVRQRVRAVYDELRRLAGAARRSRAAHRAVR